MYVNAKHLHYSIKGALDFFKYFGMAKIKHKLLHKVTKERGLNKGESIYLYLISQKKPSYGGSENCILIQYVDTKQKWYFFTNAEEYFTEKFTPF